MNNIDKGAIITMLVLLLSWSLCMVSYLHLRQQAIAHGYAEHDRVTGDWQWIIKEEAE